MGLIRLLLTLAGADQSEQDRAATRQSGPNDYSHPLEDRRKPPLDPDFAQIAGERCKSCKSTIITHKDGTWCDGCRKPIHHDCVARHASKCGAAQAPKEP